MKQKKVLQTLDDMVFENRLKDYGAYQLRKNYKVNLTRALLIGVFPFILLILSSFWIQPEVTIDFKEKERELPYTGHDLIPDPEVIPNEPPIVAQVEEVQTIVIPPDIEPVADKKVEVQIDVPTYHELENAVIGTEAFEGPSTTDAFVQGGPIEQEGIPMEAPVIIEVPVEAPVFVASEVMPKFNGGLKKMYKWLGKNLRYPHVASSNGIEGRVIVSFVVEKDGQISGIKVLKGIGFGCDKEAKRVINKMPKWSPGLQNGRPVRVSYTVPLNFQIN